MSRTIHHTTNMLLAAGLLRFAPLVAAAPAATAPAATTPPAKTAPAPVGPMAFTPAELELAPGETSLVTLFVPSPTGKYFSGTLSFLPEKGLAVQPDARWPDRIPPWGVKVFPKIT